MYIPSQQILVQKNLKKIQKIIIRIQSSITPTIKI